MTQLTDDFLHPQPEGSQGMYTQESGDAGLSSNMEHSFSDSYDENALPVPDKGSNVKPIPKVEPAIFESPGKAEESLPHPSGFLPPMGSNAEIISILGHTKPKSYFVVSEEWRVNPFTLAMVQKNNLPLQALSGDAPKEEPVNTAKTFKEKELDEEVVGGDHYTMDLEMETRGGPVEPKVVLEEERKISRPWKKAAGKNNIRRLLMIAVILLVFPGGFADQCYTCMDKEKCPNLFSIYDHNDTQLYTKEPNQTLQECSAITSPAPQTCTVCRFQANTIIVCSEDVGKLEVEASNGLLIVNISPGCEQLPRGRAYTALTPSVGLLLILVTPLVVID